MKRILIAACGVLMASTSLFAAEQSQPLEKVAPYPAAEKGMVRQVIYLPEQQDESALKLELLPGKNMDVDCNRHSLGGKFEEKTLQGWGYNYYELTQVAGPRSTMMACPDNTTKREFVGVHLGDAGMIRYNSKLPVVVYTPDNVELKYRIWRADTELQTAIKK